MCLFYCSLGPWIGAETFKLFKCWLDDRECLESIKNQWIKNGSHNDSGRDFFHKLSSGLKIKNMVGLRRLFYKIGLFYAGVKLLFYMPILKIPKGVVNRIDKIRRNFLRGGLESKRKMAKMGWKRVCRPKVVGNGTDVLFWYDVWCNDLPLKNLFLRLFCPANNKMAKVVDYSVNQSFIHDGWRDFFFRPLLDREASLLDDLCDLIKLIAVDPERCDPIIWKMDVREIENPSKGSNIPIAWLFGKTSNDGFSHWERCACGVRAMTLPLVS
ncbi:hypothetical protein J1N35_001425 [Gossypium stocksii]|uniref:Reverse transcriptase zinc-binding domain-containing protein n=1 Tax=Gossypium stocksii TaxID=47602 RepID=A0A9D3WHN4_9ROSI|nr:hypothetical protein J1N35_001425 [Gossypium stocksii]